MLSIPCHLQDILVLHASSLCFHSANLGTAGCLMSCRCDADGVEVTLEVKAHNSRAIGLYRKHGFVDVGLRRKYYADGSDALLMTRHPGAAAVGGPQPGDDTSSAACQ
jgi:hypothetical protein